MLLFWHRFIISFLLLCTGCLSVGFSVQAKDTVYTLDEYGRILVPVEYGDQTYHYLLSTSSRRIGARAGNFDALKIKQYQSSVLEDFSITGEIELPMAGLTEMRLAGRTIKDRYITVLNAKSPAAGILGYAAFGEQLIHIKPASRIIGFHAHAGAFSTDEWSLIDGRNNKYGGIIIETEYMGVKLDVLFASDLSRSVLDNRAYAALKDELPPRKKRNGFTSIIVGADANTSVFEKQLLPNFVLGDMQLGDIEVVTTKVNTKDASGKNDALMLILGADIIAQNELVLDFRDFQLWYPSSMALK